MKNIRSLRNYDADVIVVGGGVIGLCAALNVAKKGKNVILLEKFFCGTQEGSSAEHLRMWRTMYTEMNHSILSYKAGDLYKEIEEEVGKKLLYKRGLLNFGIETDYTPEGTLLTTLDVLNELGKKYIVFNKKQIEESYPFKNLPDNYIGIFQEDNAVIDVKETISSLILLNKIYGVNIIDNANVEYISSDVNGVEIKIGHKSLIAKKAILALGPFVNSLLENNFGFKLNLSIWEMCFAYYRLSDPSKNFPMWFQFDEPKNGYSNLFYGFPDMPFGRAGFLRIAVDWASKIITDPVEREYVPKIVDIKITQDYIREHMIGVDAAPIDAGTALIAHLPDNHSVLDFLPNFIPYHRNIVLCSGGWAFKFAPLFGKVCADLVTEGETVENIQTFSINRSNVIIDLNFRKDKTNRSKVARIYE